ncbi:MAG: hypothetical protein ACFCUG_04935 [Thiotrichales bacterium]
MGVQHQHLLEPVLDRYVERICSSGCAAVYGVIAAMERGELPPVVADLNGEEQRKVLAELKSIMAVYDAREGGPTCKAESTADIGQSRDFPRAWVGLKSSL